MKTYLVTGGAGFIGSHFIETLLDNTDSRVVNLDKLTYAGSLGNLTQALDNPRHVFIKGDICDSSVVDKIFSYYSIDTVVNFAAESHVDRSIKNAEPFIKTNIEGTMVLLEAALKYWNDFNDKAFIQISTDEVYGPLDKKIFADEYFPLKPGNPYSASKASGDLLAISYFKTYKLPIIITRCCNNFGPRQFPEKLIPLIIKNLAEGKSLPVYSDGMQEREWIFVKEHCEKLQAVIKLGKPGEIYNIGSGKSFLNIDLVKKLISIYSSLSKESVGLECIDFVEDRLGHDMRYGLAFGKIAKLSYKFNDFDFDKNLVDTVDSYLKRKSGEVK